MVKFEFEMSPFSYPCQHKYIIHKLHYCTSTEIKTTNIKLNISNDVCKGVNFYYKTVLNAYFVWKFDYYFFISSEILRVLFV
jgi:hypothetical protein